MSIKSLVNAARFALKANAPTIKVISGIVIATGGAVWACKATLKVQPVLADAKEAKAENDAIYGATEVSEKEVKKANLELKVHTALNVAKYYAGPVGLGAIGVALILNGHYQLKGRYVAATAAASAFQKALVDYRKRVADKYGKSEENDIWNGVTRKSVTVADEKGNKHKVKAPVTETWENLGTPLSIVFTDSYDPVKHQGSKFATRNRPDLSLLMLKNAVRNAQDQLQIKGFMTVYTFITDYLGMDPEALVLDNPMLEMSWGWKYTADDSDATSDNYIDIGIFESDWSLTREADDYLRGLKNYMLLNLNATPLFEIDNSYENKLSDILDRQAVDQK